MKDEVNRRGVISKSAAVFAVVSSAFESNAQVDPLKEMDFSIKEKLNVKDFGAKGDGSDDTAAIQAAWQAAIVQKHKAIGRDFTGVASLVLHFPAGDYIFNGPALEAKSALCLTISGDGRESSRIVIKSNDYFIKARSVIDGLTIKNLHFVGGLGCLMQTYSGPNVRSYITVDQNTFYGYEHCAIGTNANDSPYWKITNNVFYGSDRINSIGLAIGGDTSMSEICNNAFLRNKYHLKVTNPGTNIRIKDNDFIRFSRSSERTADIWLVPHTSPVNAFCGGIIADNKFGNENRGAIDFFLLFADELPFKDAIPCLTRHQEKSSAGYIVGLSIRDNYYAGVKNGAAFVTSFTANLVSLDITIRHFGASSQNSVVWIDPSAINANGYLNSRSTVKLANVVSGAETLQSRPISTGFGIINDPFGYYQGESDVFSCWQTGVDPSFVNISSSATDSKNWTLQGDGGFVRSKNADDLSVIEFYSNTILRSDIATPLVDRSGFVEFDVYSASRLGNVALVVSVVSRRQTNQIAWQRFVAIPKYRKRIRLPFILNHVDSSGMSVLLRIQGEPKPNLCAINFGRFIVYHSHEPINFSLLNYNRSVDLTDVVIDSKGIFEIEVDILGAQVGDFCLTSLNRYVPRLDLSAQVSKSDIAVVSMTNSSNRKVHLGEISLNLRVVKRFL